MKAFLQDTVIPADGHNRGTCLYFYWLSNREDIILMQTF